MAKLFGLDTATYGFDSSLFPVGDNIDLRDEFSKILRGGIGIKPKGHYVTIRHFDLSKPTEQWDPINKEARGIEPFAYVDQLVLSYRARPVLTPYNEEVIPPGLINLDTYIYYFEYTVQIDLTDFIFEYGLVDGQDIDSSNLPMPTEKYNVKMIDPRRGDSGRIEYYRVICKYESGHRT